MFLVLRFLCICLLLSGLCFAKKTQSTRTESLSPEQQLKSFHVPEGFVVELVASEKDGLINPIDLKFDDQGRLWTQTARMYPLDPFDDISWGDLLKMMDDPERQMKSPRFREILEKYQLKRKGEDQVLLISNLEQGKQPKVSVWADGLSIPQSVLPYKNGAYVAHGVDLIYFEDTNGDGKADKHTTVLRGFGITDTHTMVHTLERAPGGWINFSQGALCKGNVVALKSGASQRFDFCTTGRFSLDGMKIELVTDGRDNIWGYKLRSNGKWYGTFANDGGFSILPLEPETDFPSIGGLRQRVYQPEFPSLHSFRVGGTGIAGMAMYDDHSGAFPDEWKNVAFLSNPITNKINAVRILQDKDGSVHAEHLKDFLSCDDDWFRPINMEFGPDGCLYVVDFYNKIISHNEVKRTHPDRDKSHGRIWRIRYTGSQRASFPNVANANEEQLLEHLKSAYLWEKRAAWHQIVDRQEKSLIPQIKQIALDTKLDEATRINALYCLEGLQVKDPDLMKILLSDSSDDLRREAVRALKNLTSDLNSFASLLKPVQNDKSDLVRSQVIRSIMECDSINTSLLQILVQACDPSWSEAKGNLKPYRHKFNKYLARKSLEKFENELFSYLSTPEAKAHNFKSLSWALMALPKDKKETTFLSLWDQIKNEKVDESTFVSMAPMLSNQSIFNRVKPQIQDVPHYKDYVKLALQFRSDIQSAEMIQMITPNVIKMIREKQDVNLALDAVTIFNIKAAEGAVLELIPALTHDGLFIKSLKALKGIGSQKAEPVYQKILSQLESSFEMKLLAVQGLIHAKSKTASKSLSEFLNTISATQKQQLIKAFTGSKDEALALIQLYKSKQITDEVFDLSSAEMLAQYYRNKNIIANDILKNVRKREKEEASKFSAKLKHHLQIANSVDGNPKNGKLLFTTCLMCHKVGNEGQDIAPPLDGSAHREPEALLTAILNPNAAFEGNFNLFRVTKKDNTTLEGYQVKKDDKGITLAFMGGASTFIPKEEIAKSQFVPGRSFMPTGLIDAYSDEQVADLLAYIRTLK